MPELIGANTNYTSGLFGKRQLGGGLTGPNDQDSDEQHGAMRGVVDYTFAIESYKDNVYQGGDPQPGF